MLVKPILDGMIPVKGRGRGCPRRRPGKLHVDKDYDNRRVRHYLHRRAISLPLRVLASAAKTHGSTLFARLLEINPGVRTNEDVPVCRDASPKGCTWTGGTAIPRCADTCVGAGRPRGLQQAFLRPDLFRSASSTFLGAVRFLERE